MTNYLESKDPCSELESYYEFTFSNLPEVDENKNNLGAAANFNNQIYQALPDPQP